MRVVHGRTPCSVKEITATGLTVGRTSGGREVDLELEDPRMSRRHIRVESNVLGWVLVDIDSRNGGFVYGRAFAPGQRVALVDGAVIRLGDSLLVFRASPARAADDGDTALFPGESPLAAAVRGRLRGLVAAAGHVVIAGETGTGKEHAARFIGEASAPGRFVPVNCAELTRELARSEIFGQVRGALSGALRLERMGLGGMRWIAARSRARGAVVTSIETDGVAVLALGIVLNPDKVAALR